MLRKLGMSTRHISLFSHSTRLPTSQPGPYYDMPLPEKPVNASEFSFNHNPLSLEKSNPNKFGLVVGDSAHTVCRALHLPTNEVYYVKDFRKTKVSERDEERSQDVIEALTFTSIFAAYFLGTALGPLMIPKKILPITYQGKISGIATLEVKNHYGTLRELSEELGYSQNEIFYNKAETSPIKVINGNTYLLKPGARNEKTLSDYPDEKEFAESPIQHIDGRTFILVNKKITQVNLIKVQKRFHMKAGFWTIANGDLENYHKNFCMVPYLNSHFREEVVPNAFDFDHAFNGEMMLDGMRTWKNPEIRDALTKNLAEGYIDAHISEIDIANYEDLDDENRFPAKSDAFACFASIPKDKINKGLNWYKAKMPTTAMIKSHITLLEEFLACRREAAQLVVEKIARLMEKKSAYTPSQEAAMTRFKPAKS